VADLPDHVISATAFTLDILVTVDQQIQSSSIETIWYCAACRISP
jgi:hypothetical protein